MMKITEHILKGLDVLEQRNIQYDIIGNSESPDDEMVKLHGILSDELREIGFRVGAELFNGLQVVFYRGRFFGLTAG